MQSIERAPDATLAGLNTAGYYLGKRSVKDEVTGKIKGVAFSKPGAHEVVFGAANYGLRKAVHVVDEKYSIGEKVGGWFDGGWTPAWAQDFSAGYVKPLLAFLIKEGAYDLASALVAESAGGMISSKLGGFRSGSPIDKTDRV
jgi:hypothetical protein